MNHKHLFAHLTIALPWRGFSWPWKLCSRVKPFAPAGIPHSPLSQKQLFFLLGRGTVMVMPLGCFRGWNVNPGMPNFKKRPSFETSTLCSHPHVLDLFKWPTLKCPTSQSHTWKCSCIRTVQSMLLHPGQAVPGAEVRWLKSPANITPYKIHLVSPSIFMNW